MKGEGGGRARGKAPGRSPGLPRGVFPRPWIPRGTSKDETGLASRRPGGTRGTGNSPRAGTGFEPDDPGTSHSLYTDPILKGLCASGGAR